MSKRDPDAAPTFYITTAIDYPNSVPHVGHAYEKVVADFYARASRLRGEDVYFLIGLDEHGQKIQEAAAAAGKTPQAFVDEKAVVFQDLYRLLAVSNDDFIRTSEPRHHAFARDLYERVRARGDIYKGHYEGDYCISCERFYTPTELAGGKCPIHDRPTTLVKEESYFFRLGKYRDAVRAHIEAHPRFVTPDERRNEVLSRLREEVKDLSISRSTFDWGVPLPDDPAHVLYVWFDALSNYVSALLRPRDIFLRCWPASCHVIGKDILWFHTVIWPAMLLSAGYDLPRQVYVHGFILDQEGRKMAKHLGNVVDPLAVVNEYSVDVLRYYFLRTFSSGQDGKFSLDELEERYQSELGNDLGNLVLRVAKLVETRLGGVITLRCGSGPAGGGLDPEATLVEYFRAADAREHHRAVEALWSYIRKANAYLNDRAPWKVAQGAELTQILETAMQALRVIAHLVEPIMPQTAASIAGALGFPLGRLPLSALETSSTVTATPPLFPRRERPKAEGARGGGARQEGAGSLGPMAPPGEEEAAKDPFARLEIRIGRIKDVREHPDAGSLFAMTVDLGGGDERSICAGLRAHLTAAELAGRKVAVLANLKPALLRGVESRGMILASDRRDGKVVPVEPGDAPLGELVVVEGTRAAPKKKLSKGDFEKAPLEVRGGVVMYAGKALRTSAGELRCDADDGAVVR
jgi:methionyl-tRNA synthetase